jgi:hypothetical protein
MSTLEQRLEALEKQFEEVKKLKGVPGPRGPAGPIEAAVSNAVTNANKVVLSAEERVQARADEAIARLAYRIEHIHQEILQQRQWIQDSIKNAVENHTIQVLEDYGVVSDLDGQRIKTK